MIKIAEKSTFTTRPPIITVMGHVDHGKSTLLDYIRKTNVVDTESGGITQHLSAYEAIHKDSDGNEKRITFLDTPGHEAFSAMRARSTEVADIAILIISAEDGIKKQTLEALEEIKKSKIPYVVAINKVDLPNANPDKVKNALVENEVYLEGMGGDIPYVQISAKKGDGIAELMDMLVLVTDMAELTAVKDNSATGIIIESNVDQKKGISATMIITSGTLKKGSFISADDALSPVRAIEDFSGKQVMSATFSSPIRITGFNKVPKVGSTFNTFKSKKDAEKSVALCCDDNADCNIIGDKNAEVIIPIVIKTDVLGTLCAVKKELEKTVNEKVALNIIHSAAGEITENDIKIAAGKNNVLVVGFRVGVDSKAKSVAEKMTIEVNTFAVIYKITDFISEEVAKRTPKESVEDVTGEAKIIRVFSRNKDKQVIGGKVKSGYISLGAKVKIFRRDVEIGEGKVLELQQQKIKTNEVKEGAEFGTMIDSKKEIAEGDVIKPFVIVIK